MSRKEEELIDVRDQEGLNDKYGNSCVKVGQSYTLHSNLNGTYIISKKIPSFRYLRIRSYKNQEEACRLFEVLEREGNEQIETKIEKIEEKEIRQEDRDRLSAIRDKLMRDENLTVEEFEFLEMG